MMEDNGETSASKLVTCRANVHLQQRKVKVWILWLRITKFWRTSRARQIPRQYFGLYDAYPQGAVATMETCAVEREVTTYAVHCNGMQILSLKMECTLFQNIVC